MVPRIAVAVACLVIISGCNMQSPSSPSPITSPVSAAAGGPLRPFDEPGDDPYPIPDPGEPGIPPAPLPPAGPVKTINIVGTFGPIAFLPNPLVADVAETIVWTNDDLRLHHIVLDDGTEIGNLAPGESSLPIAVPAPVVSYHCTIHPSMVGSISVGLAPPLPAPEPGPGLEPEPDPYPDPYPYRTPGRARR
jgi:plastocyanin